METRKEKTPTIMTANAKTIARAVTTYFEIDDQEFEENLVKDINKYTIEIAEKAGDKMKSKIDTRPIDAWDRGYNAGLIEAISIISRIKTLTEES